MICPFLQNELFTRWQERPRFHCTPDHDRWRLDSNDNERLHLSAVLDSFPGTCASIVWGPWESVSGEKSNARKYLYGQGSYESDP
jgi:hypothetical protein